MLEQGNGNAEDNMLYKVYDLSLQFGGARQLRCQGFDTFLHTLKPDFCKNAKTPASYQPGLEVQRALYESLSIYHRVKEFIKKL